MGKKLKTIFLIGIFLSVLVIAQTINTLAGGHIKAVPSTQNIPFPVSLNNQEPASGFQIKINYPTYLSYDSIIPSARMQNETIVINSDTAGILKIAALFEQEISPGEGKIFDIVFNVNESATPANHTIALSNLITVDINTTILSIGEINGTFEIVDPYSFTFLPPISTFENFTLQNGATLPLKFNVTSNNQFISDNSVLVRIINQTLNIDKIYNSSGEADDNIRINETEGIYIVNVHTGELGMPLGGYSIEVTFNNFQKEEIEFELIQNGKGRGRQK